MLGLVAPNLTTDTSSYFHYWFIRPAFVVACSIKLISDVYMISPKVTRALYGNIVIFYIGKTCPGILNCIQYRQQ